MADEETTPAVEKEEQQDEEEAGKKVSSSSRNGDEASEGGAGSSKRSKRSRSRSRERKEKDGGEGGELEESSSSRRDRKDKDKDKDRDKERKRSRRSRSRSRSRSRNRSHRSGGSRRDRSRSRSRDRDSRRSDKDKDKDSSSRRRRDRSEERDERTAEQRELDELTKDQRTVFVSQLVMKADERALKKFFAQFGKVRSVVMLRDKATNRHKGFAYVEMADLEAIPPVLLMNDQVPDFQKFPVKVAASQAEKNYLAKQEAMSKGRAPAGVPTRRRDRGLPRQVYLGNLHPNITEEDLMELLNPFGTVTNLVMARNEDGTSRGFAFATFDKVEEAQTVMTQLGGVPLADRPIKVGPVNDKADHSGKNAMLMGPSGPYPGGPPQSATANWGLDNSSMAQGLTLDANSRVALMAKLGAGAGLQVPVPPTMPGAAVGNPLMGGMNALSLGAGAIPLPVQGTPSRCLLIKNLFDPFAPDQEDGWDLDIQEDVEDECGKYGAVKHVYVDPKTPGGMVYALFAEEPAATKAAHALNGRWFAGRMVSVEYMTGRAYKEKCPDAPVSAEE